MPPSAGFERLARTCPRCGTREPTLGSRCRSCGASFDASRTWLDRASDVGEDWPVMTGLGALVGALVALVALAGAAVTAVLRGAWSSIARVWAPRGRR